MRKPLVSAWTAGENERFKKMVQSGASVARCCAAFNRAGSSIRAQARKLGLELDGQRKARRTQISKISAAEEKAGPGIWRFDGTRV